MIDLGSIQTLVNLSPQVAVAVATFLIIRRAIPGDAVKELTRTLQEIHAATIRNQVKVEEHDRRLDEHNDAIHGLAQQVQTTLSSRRN